MLQTQDLLTEADILSVDHEALATFGNTPSVVSANLAAKRHIAVHSWLYGRLAKAGYSPHQHLTRYAAPVAYGYTGASYSDLTTALSDKTTDDTVLSTVLATPATDAVFLSAPEPPRALYVGLLDYPNAVPNSLQPAYWNGGRWVAMSGVADATQITTGVALSGGGVLSWTMPEDWQPRPLNTDSTYRYWLRLRVPNTLTTPTKVTHLLPIRRSRLTHPAALYTLGLMYDESWGVQRGEWDRKAKEFMKRAEDELTLALIGLNEFDTAGEQTVTTSTDQARPDPSVFEFERG